MNLCKLLLCGLVAAPIAASLPAQATPGELDTTFLSQGYHLYTASGTKVAMIVSPSGNYTVIQLVTGGNGPLLHGKEWSSRTLPASISYMAIPAWNFPQDATFPAVFAATYDGENNLYVAGEYSLNNQYNAYILKYRLTDDGNAYELDPDFGTGGALSDLEISPGVFHRIKALAVDSQNRLVIAGNASLASDMYVGRLTPNGAWDDFGQTDIDGNRLGYRVIAYPGFVFQNQSISFNFKEYVSDVAIANDDSVFILGRTADNENTNMTTTLIAKTDANGDLATDFAVTSTLPGVFEWQPPQADIVNPPFEYARHLLLDEAGNIYTSGIMSSQLGAFGDDPWLARITPAGEKDTLFGTSGNASTIIAMPGLLSVNSLDMDAANRLVLAGWSSQSDGTQSRLWAGRADSNGTMDDAFGPDATGLSSIDIPNLAESVVAAALDTHDRIVFAGNPNLVRMQNFDLTPDAFEFDDITGAALSTTAESGEIVLSGIETLGKSPIKISNGGEYRINQGEWTDAPGIVMDGDSVQVRLTSSDSFDTETSAELDVNGVVATFTARTELEDTEPADFAFTDQTDVIAGELIVSNEITVDDINSAAEISITGGEYSINNGDFTSVAGTVNDGDTVRVRVAASSAPSGTAEVTLTIGGVSDTFTVTTAAATGGNDSTPDAFSFTAVTSANTNTLVTSNTITVSGIDTAAVISITGGEYSIGGGTFTSEAGMINNGEEVRLRVMSSSQNSTSTDATLSIGGVSTTFTVTTKAESGGNNPPTTSGGGGGPVSPLTLAALLMFGAIRFRRR